MFNRQFKIPLKNLDDRAEPKAGSFTCFKSTLAASRAVTNVCCGTLYLYIHVFQSFFFEPLPNLPPTRAINALVTVLATSM